jgi:hypothetical protein
MLNFGLFDFDLVQRKDGIPNPRYFSLSSLNNFQNSETNFCETFEAEVLKIIIIMAGYNSEYSHFSYDNLIINHEKTIISNL